MADTKNHSVITLSRFFDNNVRLVAGVCSRCYLQTDDDVKIVAVNRTFLKQVENHQKALQWGSRSDNTLLQTFKPHYTLLDNDILKLPITTCGVDDCQQIVPNYGPQVQSCLNDGINDYSEIASSLYTAGTFPVRENVLKQNIQCANAPNMKDILKYNNCVKPSDINLKRLKTTNKFSSSLQCFKRCNRSDRTTVCKGVEKHENLQVYMQESLWIPPRSPHNLIEEVLFHDPWSLLVATIFLNKTSCMSARPRLAEFLKDFQSPGDVLHKRPPELEKYFFDLGLFKRRAEQVWRMSYDYIHKDWQSVNELYGIGKYGEDAYRMFILGDLDIEPTDRFLKIYRDWAKMMKNEKKQTIVNANN